ncbi:hypothetical protein GCM10027059_19570 [Myceligenerans halotolerans]
MRVPLYFLGLFLYVMAVVAIGGAVFTTTLSTGSRVATVIAGCALGCAGYVVMRAYISIADAVEEERPSGKRQTDVPERRLRLRYQGRCRECATSVPVGTEALWDPATRKIRCLACSRSDAAEPVAAGMPQVNRNARRPDGTARRAATGYRRGQRSSPEYRAMLARNAARERRRNRIAGWTIASLVVAGSATFALHDSTADREWLVEPQPAATEQELTGSTPLHCADGWNSPSIGKRGACSHHGGVVGGEPIFETTVTPAVEGKTAPERTDWGLVADRAFWSLLLGGTLGRWVWRRIADG